MRSSLTLRIIRSMDIHGLLNALYFSEITYYQSLAILQVALLFLNNDTDDVKEFGYRLLVKYSNKTKNYVPLYDVSALLGFTPITALLKGQSLLPESDSFLSTMMEAYRENFKIGGAYHTEDQRELFISFSNSTDETLAVVAPTSYGKSQLIEQTVSEHPERNIAIVVPSKALISQTRARVIQKIAPKNRRQVIVHHDMAFDPNKPIVAVVTQERLLRIFQKHPSIAFDTMFVDEAHNLLSGDKRARLLASAIIISRIRNRNVAVKYLSPFLMSSNNLQLVTDQSEIRQIKIQEKLKTEDYFLCDIIDGGRLRFYDQFMDSIYDVKKYSYSSETELLLDKRKKKNIVYLNKPKDIEQFAEIISKKIPRRISGGLDQVCAEIAEFVHPQYRILECLRHGVGYHHGSVPDVIRSYIEACFKNESTVAWIITNSTLLEGINIPAETLFILDSRKGRSNLTAPQFRNLVGRVNRFSEIFDAENGTPALLTPSIYLVNSTFSHSKANLEKYIKNVAKIDKKIDDIVENPLLTATEENDDRIRQRDDDFTFIENVESDWNYRDKPKLATTEIGRLCYIHNIYEIDIQLTEKLIQPKVETLRAQSFTIKTR
jgi:hypothetical protein